MYSLPLGFEIGSANWVFLGPHEIYEVEQFIGAANTGSFRETIYQTIKEKAILWV